MTRKLKPVETELDSEIQEAVRSLPVKLPDDTLATVGDLLKKAEEFLHLANDAVQGNALIQTTAAFLMKQGKRRGTPSILVRMDGTAVLRIIYGDDEGEDDSPALPGPVSVRSKLPPLDDLRAEATRKGVDISDLGRQKRKIIERLDLHVDPALPFEPSTADEVREGDLPQVSLPRLNR